MPFEPRESIVQRRIPGPRRGDKASRGPSWAPAESSSSPSELTARAAPPPNTPAPPPPPPGSLCLPLIPSPRCHKVILRLPSILRRPLSHATLTNRPSLYLAGPTCLFFLHTFSPVSTRTGHKKYNDCSTRTHTYTQSVFLFQ